MPREIAAKYRSRCRVCGRTVEPGERVLWARGQGVRCAEPGNCAERAMVAAEMAPERDYELAMARAEYRRNDAEYAAGYAFEASLAGMPEDLKEQFRMDDEMFRYNHGLD